MDDIYIIQFDVCVYVSMFFAEESKDYYRLRMIDSSFYNPMIFINGFKEKVQEKDLNFII